MCAAGGCAARGCSARGARPRGRGPRTSSAAPALSSPRTTSRRCGRSPAGAAALRGCRPRRPSSAPRSTPAPSSVCTSCAPPGISSLLNGCGTSSRSTGPRVAASLAARWRQLGLPPELRDHATEVLVAAIGEQGPLTRADAGACSNGLASRRGPAAPTPAPARRARRRPHQRADAGAPAHLGTRRRPDPAARTSPPSAREVLRELVRTFVRSHAPVTERDLAWWSGLSLTDVRKGLEAGRPELDVLELGGRRYWHAGRPDRGRR